MHSTLSQPALPGRHHIYIADVTDKDALIGAARAFDAAVGGTDIVIANAGISRWREDRVL